MVETRVKVAVGVIVGLLAGVPVGSGDEGERGYGMVSLSESQVRWRWVTRVLPLEKRQPPLDPPPLENYRRKEIEMKIEAKMKRDVNKA